MAFIEKMKEWRKMTRYNLRCEKHFLKSQEITLQKKIAFIFNKYYNILLKKESIKYLNKIFYYDNRFVPALLQLYPAEINEIGTKINLKTISTVLDIGANIGQWSYTLKSFFPHLKIYSFEPNKNIFNILKRNSSYFTEWKVYNCALGRKDSKKKLYYSPEASAEGSFYKENLYQNYRRKEIRETTINMIKLDKKKMQELKIPHKIDLLKIDVEGFEIEVLQSLRDIDFKYLSIEISLGRIGESSVGNIILLIKKIFNKDAKILYYNIPDKESLNANALFILNN